MTTILAIADDRALGSSLRVIVTRPDSLLAAKAAVDEVVASVDAAASRFRADSELSLLNAKPDVVVKVSPLLAHAIATAMRGAQITNGAVDPTVGSAVRLSGYDADFDAVAANGGAMKLIAERVPGWRAVRFSEASRTVVVPRGVELDLGATGKAFAADLAAASAAKAISGGGVLVSLGGDIAVGGEAPAGGWLIQASEDSSAPISDAEETVAITNGGVATSGTTVRRWIRGGAVLHHIIDPSTSRPAESCWRTVTVVAASCVDANIASTAAIVMGPNAVPWLERHGLAARLVDNDGVVHRVAGWPR
jgi:thiamine biosynthesis lipoprotein